MNRAERDAIGKTADERFAEIRRYFLEMLALHGSARMELYYRPKPGDSREPTEEDVVRHWAQQLGVPVNDICIGMHRAFAAALERRQVVTSFRYCVPHIITRLAELKEARVGQWGGS